MNPVAAPAVHVFVIFIANSISWSPTKAISTARFENFCSITCIDTATLGELKRFDD